MREREQFLTVLYCGPLYEPDAVVVLMGEDAMPRMRTAAQMMLQMRSLTAPVVLTGALHDPPAKIGAAEGAGMLLGAGVSPGRVLVEPTATNTFEQAVAVLEMAKLNEWTRLALMPSSYHLPRAFLTFVKVLQDDGSDTDIYVMPGPDIGAPWWALPEGVPATRLELLGHEYTKIDAYAAKGHVASWADGLEYLRFWEARITEEDPDG